MLQDNVKDLAEVWRGTQYLLRLSIAHMFLKEVLFYEGEAIDNRVFSDNRQLFFLFVLTNADMTILRD